MVKKIQMKTMLTVILSLIVGIGVGITGMMMFSNKYKNPVEEETAQEETEKLVTDMIAIVNMDEGALVEDEKINYATMLLTNLKSNFQITGLEDARKGYETGIYAGYLVIPATFSDSVLSLNDVPVRAEISYAINNGLREDIKEKVIYDTINLVEELNSEVSYMYMHSVLDELHDAQNQAGIIMDNDLKEKDAINNIQANDLVALVPVSEITQVEYNIEPVDISEYMAKNGELTRLVGEKYTGYIMESETEHQNINTQAVSLMAEMGNMTAIVSGIDLAHDEDGNSIYQKGEEELQNLFQEHNASLDETQAQIEQNVIQNYTIVQNYLKEYEHAMAVYQSENEQKYLRTLNALQQLFETYRQNYVLISTEDLQMLLNEENEAYGIETFDESEPEENTPPAIIELTQLQQEMQQVLEENYYIFSGDLLDEDGNAVKDEEGNNIKMNSLLEKYAKDLTDETIRAEVLQQEVGSIERMEISSVTDVVQEKIMQPIQEKADSIIKAITDQYAVEKEQLTLFQKSITEYNPMKYINHEEIAELTSQMFENGAGLSRAIAETDIQQMEYVASVYEATRKDLTNMQENIQQAKEDSDKAVEEGLQALKNVKNENSITNQQIMLDFSEKLPYTRLGNLEYTEVYEFMADPISSVNLNEAVSQREIGGDTVKTDKESVETHAAVRNDNQIIIMIISVMFCGVIVFWTIKYHFHKKKISDGKRL